MSRLDALRAGAAGAPGVGAAGARAGEDAKLRRSALQLQGVFVQELLKAMRTTVPQGEGAFDGGSGEELFTGLMDQHLAVETPHPWARGLGDAIYEHLRGRVSAATTPDASPTPGADPGAAALPDAPRIVASMTTPVPPSASPSGPGSIPASATTLPQTTLTALRAAGR